MTEPDRLAGADCEVFPDYETGKVVSRFTHDGEVVMEIHLDPETARDFAYNQTRASIAIEENERHR